MVRHFGLLLSLVLLPTAAAWADRSGKAEPFTVETLPVVAGRERMEVAVLHEDPPAAPLAEGEKPAPRFLPTAPTRLFGGTVDETRCRLPQVSADGWSFAALCSGVHPKHREGEYLVARTAGAIVRVPVELAPGLGLDGFHMDSTGRFLGVVARESGTNTVLVLDLHDRVLHRWSGGFHDPVAVRVGRGGVRVAIGAEIGRSQAVLVVTDGSGVAQVASRGSASRLLDVADDAAQVLVAEGGGAFVHARLVDVSSGVMWDLSGRKGDVVQGSLDPRAQTAVFSSRIGGVCAVFGVDLVARRRDELVPGVDHCFDFTSVDGELGRYAWVERGRPRGAAAEVVQVAVWSPKGHGVFFRPPAGCVEPTLAAAGRLLAVRCFAEPGVATWLLPLPESSR